MLNVVYAKMGWRESVYHIYITLGMNTKCYLIIWKKREGKWLEYLIYLVKNI